uniref:Uncharacterized protein n=1 Tax=Romanomermis culicivorax TaxID=13658 RepID=A0A915IVC1_ROMCU
MAKGGTSANGDNDRLTMFDVGLNFISLILLLNHHLQKCSCKNFTEQRTNVDSIRCYSCMSGSYEHYFSLALYQVFARPMNFTDHCNDPKKSRINLPLVECNSICISMQEETEILVPPSSCTPVLEASLTDIAYEIRMVAYSGFSSTEFNWRFLILIVRNDHQEVVDYGMSFTGHIRGCYDKMLIHGFNQTIVRWYKWIHRDSCHYYNKQDVLQLHNKKRDQIHRHKNLAMQSRSSASLSSLTSNDVNRNFFLKSHHHSQTSITDDDDPASNGKNAVNQILICTCFSDGCNGSLSLNRAGWFNNRSNYHKHLKSFHYFHNPSDCVQFQKRLWGKHLYSDISKSFEDLMR